MMKTIRLVLYRQGFARQVGTVMVLVIWRPHEKRNSGSVGALSLEEFQIIL